MPIARSLASQRDLVPTYRRHRPQSMSDMADLGGINDRRALSKPLAHRLRRQLRAAGGGSGENASTGFDVT